MSEAGAGRPGGTVPRVLLMVGGVYLVALAAGPWISSAVLLGLAGFTAMAVGLAWLRSSEREMTALAGWIPVHLLLLATGSLVSPLLPLAGGWIVLLAVVSPGLAVPAAGGVALLVPAVHRLAAGAWPDTGAIVSHLLLLSLAAAVLLVLRERPTGAPPRRREEESAGEPAASPAPIDAAAPGDPLAESLEIIRRAAGADQAALWEGDGGSRTARLRAWAGDDETAPEPTVSLAGHPFEITILERMNIQLERGRKPLPSEWAAEMLLVPVDLPEGLLTLSFREHATPAAGEAARRGAEHLRELERLRAVDREAALGRRRVEAVNRVARALPAELDLREFGALLARTVMESIDTSGVIVASWAAADGRGQVLGGAGDGAPVEGGFGEGESRLALAVKHGTVLSYDDLAAERPALPLISPGESFERPARSVIISPLLQEGEAEGAVAVWHAEAGRLGEEDRDFISLLCSLAGHSLLAARRYTEMGERASTDSLTRLPNRPAFEARLAALGSHFQRYARPFGVIILDIDHFKTFNDRWGHEAGDEVLRQVGALLASTVRDIDMAARLGGEEFVMLLPETGLEASVEAAERIRRAIENASVRWSGQELKVTASLGVAACPASSDRPEELLAMADEALYGSKSGGRNRVSAPNSHRDNTLGGAARA